MDSQEHIVIVSPIYPSSHRPVLGTFTQVLARNLVRLGVKTTVIVPTKFWEPHAGSSSKQLDSAGAVEPAICRPPYLTFSSKYLPVLGSTLRWTLITFERAVRRAVRDLMPRPTHLYGQFLFPAGYTAARLSRDIGARSVVDVGESYLDFYERHLGTSIVRQAFDATDSIVTVADHLRQTCINRYRIPGSKIATFGNAAAPDFIPRDREQARVQLGLPLDRPIIGFVGTLNPNKRPWYVLEAIGDRPDIGAFFLGNTVSRRPRSSQVLFAGAVPHEQVPVWLSAADLYVHASLVEMSSNAIVEAKACGLPVVATDIPGNRELLDPEYSILVDPLDQGMMSQAIFKLIDDAELRNRMSNAALQAAQQYTSLDRARNILSWITSR